MYAVAAGLIIIGIVLGISLPLTLRGSSSANNGNGAKSSSLTLLVGLDGFRMDYLDKTSTPNLYAFFQKAAVSSLQPVFPSQSFPNQYSMITGLVPGKHGLVGDYFHSRSVNAEYPASYSRNNSYNSVNNPVFYYGTPLWQTVQAAGYTSGTVSWPGSEAGINTISPTFQLAFNKTQTDDFRVSAVTNWMNGIGVDGSKVVTPAFIATHMRVMDVAGTALGTDVSKLQPNLTSLDVTFGKMLAAVDAFKSGPCNMIVVSDHGMATVDNSKVIYYEDLFDVTNTNTIVVQNRPMAYIYTDSTFDLTSFQTKAKGFASSITVYIKGQNDAPGFSGITSDRIPDILILPNEGAVLAYKSPGFPRAPVSGGSAGYMHTLVSMEGVFAGYGPAFKSGVKSTGAVGSVRTVDIYALLIKLVGVKSASGVDAVADGFKELMV
ncbi:UNVERIFIED_CONTAM: hypothetical protein HDU68_006313 [Siphonaria sp. JEL0065]|nr:hypothetical protein HDU68_006313 [Siphonaria sp. JEL0065]